MGSVPEVAMKEKNLLRFKSKHDAPIRISLMSDQFANRVAASMGASRGKHADGYQILLELNLKEDFSPMINRLKEMREIEAECNARKPSPRQKSL